jgi:hypothetical protein
MSTTADSSILYAFLVTVFGFLVSLSAALIAGLKHRSKNQARVRTTKQQHMSVSHRRVFYGGGDPQYMRRLGRHQFGSNRAAVLDLEFDFILAPEQKPSGRFTTVLIDAKRDRVYQRLHPCIAR